MSDQTSEKKVNEWIKLSECPYSATTRFCVPFQINPNEFVIVGSSNDGKGAQAILKYNISDNKWSEWIKYPANFKSTYHTASFDKANNMIYIYNSQQKVVKIDVTTKKFETISVAGYDGSYASSLVIDGEFHVFGGWNHAKHLIWNDNNKRFTEIYHFQGFETAYNGYVAHTAIYAKSQNKIYLMGGKNKNYSMLFKDAMDTIYCCSNTNKKWSKLEIKLPIPLYQFAAVITGNERYIIVMKDEIYVLDLHTMRFSESKVLLPESCRRALVYEKYECKDVLVHGYIRYCTSMWSALHYLSEDLINIIIAFYSNECIHMISGERNHWKISVDLIINSL